MRAIRLELDRAALVTCAAAGPQSWPRDIGRASQSGEAGGLGLAGAFANEPLSRRKLASN